MAQDNRSASAPSRRTRLGVMVAVAALHLLVILGLIRAFAPDLANQAVDKVLSTFTVTITAPPPPPPPAPQAEAAGAQGDAGRKAEPRPVAAPSPKVSLAPRPAPRASASGVADNAGATTAGGGTGAGGSGSGTGAGGAGSGAGGGLAAKPSVRSGEINDARDFPVPPGGRQSRFGKTVIVHFMVTTDGRARDCTVASSSVDAETTARVCPLVVQRIRFNPARLADGTAVEARYGYRVSFTAR